MNRQKQLRQWSHLYKGYVDDKYIGTKKNEPDNLLEKLNSYHPNIKLTTEKNPT